MSDRQVEEIKEQELISEEMAAEQGEKRRRSTSGDVDSGVVRLKIAGVLGARIRETVMELKNRGVSVSAEEIMSEYLDRIPARYFESQLLKFTPERFYIETAIGMPEVREKLIRQAKRSLEKFASEEGTNRRAAGRSSGAEGVELETEASGGA